MSPSPNHDGLPGIALPEQPDLSPDGQIAYVLRTDDTDADRVVRNLWLTPVTDGDARQLTYGGGDSAPRWSPDGSQLAFVRSQDGPGQLWRLSARGGEPEQLTTLPLGAGTPWWSPDGKRIAFCAPVDLTAEADEDDAARERRSDAPIVADRLDYQADGAGLFGTRRQHVHILDLDSHEVRQVTEGDWHAGEPAWSPDATMLAFPAARDADSDRTSRAAAYVIDAVDAQAQPVLAGLADGVAGPMAWTADGTGLLVIGYPQDPVGHAHLLRLRVEDGSLTDLSAALDRNVMPGGPGYPGALPVLTDEGRTVLFCARERGCTFVYSVGVDGGQPQLVFGGPGRNVSGLSVEGSTAALVLGTPTSFGEVVALSLDSGIEAVRSGHGEAAAAHFSRVEREFHISDGSVIHGWLVRDPDATSPQPLLLDIHGGPHNAWNGAADPAHLYHHQLASRGWTVLLLNPRGSDGYGEGFYDGVHGSWGSADANDFLEPLDQLVTEGIADAGRLAITGYSYGGFMTCYLTSIDDRFTAAVAGGLVADLASETGTADAGPYLGRFELGGMPWDEPDRYSSMSPITRVDQVETPTLVLHGAEDRRCSVGQAQQWFAALRQRDVPTRLVLYPGASHLFILDGRPSHRLDYNRLRPLATPPVRPRGAARRPRRFPRHPAHQSERGRRRAGRGRVRRAQQGHRSAGHHRLAVPDRVDHQGVDGHGGYAAGGRRTSRPRRAAPRGAARPAADGPGRHQAGDHAPPADPHQRHRRRRLHRHRPRRRLPGAVRGAPGPAGPEPSDRGHLVVLQLRLRTHGPGHREADRGHLGPGDARAAFRSARADAHGHAAGGGAAL